ncbi:hypothetical protein [Enterobacter cloacae]|uniref:Ead/Ea22-like family protein n=1 Tax=Enterobacter cloacae TaxID=550 RepID=A0AA42R3J3_ENTCL|nr:hypothetical protein [Enterobacter cloacae]MDH0439096.1 hypothetical protein [Enterobacter cloacae]MDH1482283.1 hypothetical protein [Enterobacter cloacae]
MSNIDKQAQYESKFSRLWERYDEASHGNAEQMRDILEVTLDALESAERQILRLEKLAEAESVCADKAAASGIEWMKRCLAAEKRIAEMEALEVRLTDINEYLAEVHDKTLNRAFRLLAEGVRAGDVAAMRAAGINVSAAGKGEAS